MKNYEATAETVNGTAEMIGSVLKLQDIRRSLASVRTALRAAGVEKSDAGHETIPVMFSRDYKHIGVILNKNAGLCRMEGCTGHRMYVRWEDGGKTFPCSKGCDCIGNGLQKIH